MKDEAMIVVYRVQSLIPNPRHLTVAILLALLTVVWARGNEAKTTTVQIGLVDLSDTKLQETTGQLEFSIMARQPILPGQQNGICVKQGGLTAAEERRLTVYAKTHGYLVWKRRNGRTEAWLETDRHRGLHETGGARQVTCKQRRDVGASENWTVPQHTWNEVSWDEGSQTISLIGRVMVKEVVPWKTRYAVRHEYHIRWNIRDGRVFARYDRNGFRDFELRIRTPGYLWQQIVRRRGHAGHLYTTLEGSGSGPPGGIEMGNGKWPDEGGWKTETTPGERQLARTREYNQRPPSTFTKVARTMGNLAGTYIKDAYVVPAMQQENTQNADFDPVVESETRRREPVKGVEQRTVPRANSTAQHKEETTRLSALLTDAMDYKWSDSRWYSWYGELRNLPNVTEAEVVRYVRDLDYSRREIGRHRPDVDFTFTQEYIERLGEPRQGPVMRAAPRAVPVSDVWSDVQVSLAAQFASWVNDGVPFASFAKAGIEVWTGRDPWTGQQIDPAMQWAGLAVSAAPGGKIVFRTTRLAVKKNGKFLRGTAKGLTKAIDKIRRDQGSKALRNKIYIFREVWDVTGAGQMRAERRVPPDAVPLYQDTSRASELARELKTMPYVPPDPKDR